MQFVETQAQPLGNLKEMITVSLNRQLRDKYIVFKPLAGWIHEFKIEPKESEARPERLSVYFCLDSNLAHPSSFCGISTHEHSPGCSGDIRSYPFCSDPSATFDPFKEYQVFESKAAYLASLTKDHVVNKPVSG